jgi:hypothetical protein
MCLRDWLRFLILPCVVLFNLHRVVAADAPAIYRMDQLEEAKRRAAAEDKPIGWIASYPEYLAPYAKIRGNGSHAATAYAIRAFQNETVLVFSDARTENHHEPKIVDEALHSPNPHYTVPGVVILTPALDKVICTAPFASDAKERIRIFTEALKKIRDKNSWKSAEK